MTTGWQTSERPAERRLSDEAEHVLFFITEVLYRMIPPFYESLERAIRDTYPEDQRRIRVTELVRFATSIGGDMDGHPTVTAKSIRDTLARQRSLILDLYYNECRALGVHLSQSEDRCSFSPGIAARIAEYRGHFPAAAYSVPLRHGRMPYRMLLRLIQARLQATFDDAAFPYESPEEFIADIELIGDSLRANLGRNAGLFAVERLLKRARTFRFYIATLDLRQSATAHRQVIGAALGDVDWSARTSAVRAARIKQAILRRESPSGMLSSDARRTLSVFRTIAHGRRRYGERSIGLYVVRGVDGPDDVLSVLLLAKWSQLGPKGGMVPLDIAPLFQTGEELEHAAAIMSSLLADDVYRAHLAGRGNRQFVAVGYAVSNRHGDVLSARWRLNKAQIELADTARRAGIELVLVHGHGGSFSRAGGSLHEAIRALPPTAVSPHLRVTEQGETINTRYGLRGLALRSLEQLVNAVLWETSHQTSPPTSEESWHEAMAFMAQASGAAFEELVFDKSFADYFRAATPIDVIVRMGIGAGSEAAAASPVEGVHEAAWTLAWVQCRCLLPAWYGFAAGVRATRAHYGVDLLKTMLAEWPFFKLLVADVEFALGKADLLVAEGYSAMAGEAHARYFPQIRNEYAQACEAVLELTGEERLLARSSTMARSIQLRNPYVDPMSFLQVNLLERWRSGGRKTDAVFQALVASVNGIAHAMQDAG
jgi:phosphoenolpyruvate carboxylase